MALLALLALLLLFPTMTLSSRASESRTATPSTQPGRATLKLVQVSPLTVLGRSFKPGEKVRVSADNRRKTVTAGTRGGFTVTFPNANPCNGVVVTAVGSRGSRASVVFSQLAKIHCVAP
jgi:hypothetical protein